ncbi:MAG: sigma-70 family RNA polymerase sigma factor [Pirellulales bacterium]|nr:sigma-70 family RNA polymerase sigma factor [Pirellulales bacterium]
MPGSCDERTPKGSSSERRRSEIAGQAELDALIVQARGGSVAALDELIERLSEHLWAELRGRRGKRNTGASHGSSDLVQDTLVRVREQFDKFERDTFADFKRWARAVLYRRRQEWSRNYHARNDERHKRMIWNELHSRSAAEQGGSQGVSPAEQREELERAFSLFQALKPNEQFIIDLRLLNGLSYKEISAMTGSTEDATRKAYDRAMTRLKASYYDNG